MGFRNVVNDGSSNPPRLRMQCSPQGLSQLPRGEMEWSITEKLDRLASLGFGGYVAQPQTEQEADHLAAMLHDRGLGIGFATTAAEADELLPAIELAHRMRADYLTARVKGSLEASPEIADLLGDMYGVANDAGLPLFIETHRGDVTQDLRRTIKVVNRFKKVRFAGDFSHYVVAGGLEGAWSEDIWDHFNQIARRCGAWKGRISFGHQIQNDIGDGSSAMPQQFKKLWTAGMAAWLGKSRPGDVLPFTCELGAPPISLVDATGRETSDRWDQTLVIKRLAEEAWAAAQVEPTVAAEVAQASPVAASEE